jgi:hypothetical protein
MSNTWKVMFFKGRGERNSPDFYSEDLAVFWSKTTMPLLPFFFLLFHCCFYFLNAITRLIITGATLPTSLCVWSALTTHPLTTCIANSLRILLRVSG